MALSVVNNSTSAFSRALLGFCMNHLQASDGNSESTVLWLYLPSSICVSDLVLSPFCYHLIISLHVLFSAEMAAIFILVRRQHG